MTEEYKPKLRNLFRDAQEPNLTVQQAIDLLRVAIENGDAAISQAVLKNNSENIKTALKDRDKAGFTPFMSALMMPRQNETEKKDRASVIKTFEDAGANKISDEDITRAKEQLVKDKEAWEKSPQVNGRALQYFILKTREAEIKDTIEKYKQDHNSPIPGAALEKDRLQQMGVQAPNEQIAGLTPSQVKDYAALVAAKESAYKA